MKFSITTLGCKVNSYESEALINYLTSKDWIYLDKNSNEQADVCIINTCTVTSMSDQKSRQVIRNMKKKNPQAIIVAMGCYVQMHASDASMLADIIMGTTNRLQVYDLVNSYIKTRNEINQVMNSVEDVFSTNEYEDMKISKLNTHTRGFIKIQDGCENYCSYCAIPYARGKVKSRDPESVISEIKNLVSLGTKEIIISGINTGCYGKDLTDMSLAKMIRRIMEETNIYRLRISSIELMEITDELLEVIKKYYSRIAHHMHIPLQGGCNSVLKRMHRKYNVEEYYQVIEKIRQIDQNIAITTDFLGGFVGETEEEFSDAIGFIKKIGFSDMHIFPYSRRKGTEADLMPNHLPEQIKRSRTNQLLEIAKEMKKQYEEKFVGQVLEVIVEAKKQDYWHGHTSNYLDVYFKDHQVSENELVQVRILEVKDQIIYGEIIK